MEVEEDEMKPQFTVLMIMAFAVGVLAPAAHAGMFVLSLDDLGTPGIDALIGDDAPIGTGTTRGPTTHADISPLVDTIMFDSNLGGPVGRFINVNVYSFKDPNYIGSPTEARLALSSASVSGAGTLKIMATATDYLLPTQPGMHTLTSMIGGITDGTVTLEQWLDPVNAQFGMGHSPGLQGPFGPGAFSDTATVSFALGQNPFSMTEVVTIVHTGAGQSTSFGAKSAAVPEPGAVILGSIGLSFGGWLMRRKKTI